MARLRMASLMVLRLMVLVLVVFSFTFAFEWLERLRRCCFGCLVRLSRCGGGYLCGRFRLAPLRERLSGQRLESAAAE